jgi:hypothetical protein
MSDTTAIVKPLAVRRKAAAAMIGCGTTKLDQLIASGQIKATKNGKNLLVMVAELERFLAALPTATLKLPYSKRVKTTEAA